MKKFKGTMMTSQPSIIQNAIRDKEALDAIGVHYTFTNVDPMYYHLDYTLSVETNGYSDAKELHDEMVKEAIEKGIILIITTEEVSC